MQYILTQAEYDELKAVKKKTEELEKKELQEICIKAAMYIPVKIEWSNGATRVEHPWGCILGPSKQNPMCCDDCPVQKLCPNPDKEWSQ